MLRFSRLSVPDFCLRRSLTIAAWAAVVLPFAPAAAAAAAEAAQPKRVGPADTSTAQEAESALRYDVVQLPLYIAIGHRVANPEPQATFAMPVSALRYEPGVDVQARNLAEGQADFVLGTRMQGGMLPGAMPPHQAFGNQLVARLLRLLYGLGLSDLGPYRVIRRELLDALALRERTYGWPVEMMVKAARLKDSGQRMDVEAGMAKMLASEYCNEVVEASFRIHGGYGYSKEYEIERLYRESAFMLIGEGTSDIQKMIIGRSLLKDYALR